MILSNEIFSLNSIIKKDRSFNMLDEIHIYSKAMSETEVKRLAGRLFLDLSGKRLHAVPIGTDFNMSAPPAAGATGNNQGVSTERPGVREKESFTLETSFISIHYIISLTSSFVRWLT